MLIDMHKAVIGLGLAAMLFDLVVPHTGPNAENDYGRDGIIRQPNVLVDFTNERQWLFDHRQYMNQCALEALAEGSGSSEGVRSASSGDSILLPDRGAGWRVPL